MKTLILLLSTCILLGSTVGCATHQGLQARAPFLAYLVSFNYDAQRFGHNVNFLNVTVEFGPMPYPRWAAYCKSGSYTPSIVVDQVYWDASSAAQREQLMYHELGHCLLGQHHRLNSIMAEGGVDDDLYVSNREYWLHELFAH